MIISCSAKNVLDCHAKRSLHDNTKDERQLFYVGKPDEGQLGVGESSGVFRDQVRTIAEPAFRSCCLPWAELGDQVGRAWVGLVVGGGMRWICCVVWSEWGRMNLLFVGVCLIAWG